MFGIDEHKTSKHKTNTKFYDRVQSHINLENKPNRKSKFEIIQD